MLLSASVNSVASCKIIGFCLSLEPRRGGHQYTKERQGNSRDLTEGNKGNKGKRQPKSNPSLPSLPSVKNLFLSFLNDLVLKSCLGRARCCFGQRGLDE
jgi:hypothetical protein